jgi:5-epi-alpha-selinene synthase
MICGIYPSAGLEELFLCCDWYNWGFTYDDMCDNLEFSTQLYEFDQIQAHLLAVFQDSPLVSVREPVVAMLSDIWQRARQLTSATWQQRFARHHVEYFASLQQEFANRLHQQIPSMQAYIMNRRLTAASTVCLDLIELVHHIEIPVEVYESHPFQAILNSTYDIVHWTNDVYSLSKELAYGEVNNLVVVVQHQERCSLQDALNRVCAMINRETQHFQELVQCLPPYPLEVGRAIRAYLVDVGHYIRTALDYERTGSRYQGLVCTTSTLNEDWSGIRA